MKSVRWALIGLLAAVALAQSQAVYNYFPPPGISYSPTAGMVLGSAAGAAFGAGTLNAQGLYVNGVPVGSSTGSVTSVSVASANGLSGTVATPTSTPAITLAPTFTGIGYSTGAAFQAAIAANFPTLNQDTTGHAGTATLATAASALAAAPSLCASGQAAQGILANGNATGCITPYSVINEAANTFFAGPASGTPALPSFRAMAAADLPLSLIADMDRLYHDDSGEWRRACDQWECEQRFRGFTDGANQWGPRSSEAPLQGSRTAWMSYAGTNSSDVALRVGNHSGSSYFLSMLRETERLSVYDSSGGGPFQVGYLGTPINAQGAPYTLQLSDRGKTIELTGSSGTVTIPSGVFSPGDVITVLAFSGTTSYTISPGGGVTLYWAIGNLTTGSRTLTSVGLATILCVTSTSFAITGSGIT